MSAFDELAQGDPAELRRVLGALVEQHADYSPPSGRTWGRKTCRYCGSSVRTFVMGDRGHGRREQVGGQVPRIVHAPACVVASPLVAALRAELAAGRPAP